MTVEDGICDHCGCAREMISSNGVTTPEEGDRHEVYECPECGDVEHVHLVAGPEFYDD